jgi:hypothetical protein
VAELINIFSWSFSAAEDFDECRRRRYWAKYAMWGGWSADATPLQRAAYRLGKMDNRYSLLGDTVETAVMWVLRRKQAGEDVTVEQTYETVARPFLNTAWKESRERRWEKDPRKYRCLREHYYGELNEESQKAWVAYVAGQTRRCIGHFIQQVLSKLQGVVKEQEVPIAKIGMGDPESFTFEGIKIYAIPDYVYRRESDFHIYDWKAGKPKDSHRDQLALYGLWANVKHGVPAERIAVSIEYLSEGTAESRRLGPGDLDAVKQRIAESVADMADYLVDGDIRRNRPLPVEEWDLAASRDACRLCNFFELCKPELG